MATVGGLVKPVLAYIETSSAKMKEAMHAYPSELSAMSAHTPISAHPLSANRPFHSPICPPMAYTNFLKSRNPPTSRVARSSPSSPLSSASSSNSSAPVACPAISVTPYEWSPSGSGRSPGRARASSTSCITSPALLEKGQMVKVEDDSDDEHDMRTRSRHHVPSDMPMSAPLMSFPSLHVPLSPSLSTPGDSPMSATFSATSPCFPFNRAPASPASWDRLHHLSAAAAAAASGKSQRTVRYRSVVTRTIRTVTFAPPRLNAALTERAKRRKVDT